MSKLEILQRTINYIKDLNEALDEDLPSSPSKIANVDIPKKPRAKRTKPTQLFSKSTDSEATQSEITSEETKPKNFDLSANQVYQPQPWETQVERVSTESQENFSSCRYTENNQVSTNDLYMLYNSLSNANHLQSPVDSHCSAYSSSTQSSCDENQWCIDFSTSANEYTNEMYLNNNFKNDQGCWWPTESI